MKHILTTFTLFSLVGSLFAQTHNEQVTVIAPFRPTVLDAYKINITPQTIDSALTPRDMRFNILSRKVTTSFDIDNIRPARVAGEPLSKLSPLHVRGGFGNYLTGYGELFYGSTRSAQWQYGAHLKHHSSQGTFKDHEVPFDNSVNLVNLYGGYMGKKVLLSADFYYDRKRHSAYGASHGYITHLRPRFVEDDLHKFIYNNTGGNIRFSDNNTEPNSLGYSGNLNIDIFQPNTPAFLEENEVSLYFTGNVHRTFDFRHPIFNQTIVGLDVSADWHKWNIDDLTFPDSDVMHINNPKMLKFRPYGKLRFSGHDFSLGVRVNTFDEPDFDALKVKTEFQLVPTVHAKFNLIDNLFAIEFGMDGDAEYMTHKKTVQINPFTSWFPLQSLSHPQLHREYYLGLNTALSKTIDLALKGKLTSYTNFLNFDVSKALPTSGITETPFFDLTHDTINCIQLQANLNYHLDDKIAVSAMGRVNFYDGDILYKPKYEAHLTARYNMQDKIILKTQLYFSADRYYKKYVRRDPIEGWIYDLKKFKPIVDWSIGAEYRFDKRWGAFLEVNNVLGQRYYEWYNYRSYGVNFLLGATFNL